MRGRGWHFGGDLKMAARALWGGLSLLRIAWCLLPQTGYLHPDEFFQSPEVMAEDILGLEAYRPWEFRAGSACRTVVFPLLTSGTAFWLMRLCERLGLLRAGPGDSYALLVAPRLLLTSCSFALDWAVHRLAPIWGADRWAALALLAGSHVTLVFYTRTFANAIEGLLFACLLVLVSPRPGPGPEGPAWPVGAVVAAGFFNRPTFPAFALAPLWFRSVRRAAPGARPGPGALARDALELAPAAALTAAAFVAADTCYFGSPVLTPYRFLSYNLDPRNLARHGTHPRVTHLLVNGVMLFGTLHVAAVAAGCRALKAGCPVRARPGAPLPPRGHAVLLLFYFVPLVLLSLFSHQEPRFLIPLLVPLVLVSSPRGRPVQHKASVVVFNALGALFFGCLHQGGLVPGLARLEQIVHSPPPPGRPPDRFTLLFAHTYMPPRHLLNLRGQEAPVEVVDLGGAEAGVLCEALERLGRRRACRLFVVTPGTMWPAVDSCGFPVKNQTLLFPHLTLEDPPALSALLGRGWRSQLGLLLLELGEPEGEERDAGRASAVPGAHPG
ncbi:GPI mannosyltransferase 4 [Tachyglossus aculeatus]|uniref:GPI mannosyltransferase 4 n=1 Tax=Tachyglossus aculeatus TaxID=9261 RepID=UPI0018F6117A|nr:GPI mannosyltransferase 4 [Tachyglossus aculeatus]